MWGLDAAWHAQADLEKMGQGLNKLAQEDPSFNYSRDEETGQTVIEGMGELHLEIIVDRLRREFKVSCGLRGAALRQGVCSSRPCGGDAGAHTRSAHTCVARCDVRGAQVECEVGAPQVNYREGISRSAEVRYVHKKQSGGSGQFADVAVRFEPSDPGSGFEFKSDIKGGAVPKEYIPGVLKVSRRDTRASPGQQHFLSPRREPECVLALPFLRCSRSFPSCRVSRRA